MLQRYNIQSESDIREAMQLREARIAIQQADDRLAVPPATKMVQLKRGMGARTKGAVNCSPQHQPVAATKLGSGG
jgi:hypothetical protein